MAIFNSYVSLPEGTQPFLQRWGPIHGDIMAILVENMIMNHWEFGGLHKTIIQTDFSYGYSNPWFFLCCPSVPTHGWAEIALVELVGACFKMCYHIYTHLSSLIICMCMHMHIHTTYMSRFGAVPTSYVVSVAKIILRFIRGGTA